MHSLYWRIFRSFWLAIVLILVGTVTVAVSAAIQRREELPWVQRGQLFGQAAAAFESGGPDALREWLDDIATDPAFKRTYVVGPTGRDLLNRPLPHNLLVPVDARTKHGQKTVRSGAIANHRDGYRTASHEDQQLVSPGDMFFEFASKVKHEEFDIKFD